MSSVSAFASFAACVGDDVSVTGGSDALDASSDGAPGSDALAPTAEAAVDAGDGGGDAGPAGCGADVPGNLLPNGTFRLGTAGWGTTGSATLTEAVDAGADCIGTYVIVTTTDTWSGLNFEGIRLPNQADAGAPDAGSVTVDFGAWVRPLDGTADELHASLASFDIQPNEAQTVPSGVLDPAVWTEVKGSLTVTPGYPLTLRIDAELVRRFGVDRAWVTVRGP